MGVKSVGLYKFKALRGQSIWENKDTVESVVFVLLSLLDQEEEEEEEEDVVDDRRTVFEFEHGDDLSIFNDTKCKGWIFLLKKEDDFNKNKGEVDETKRGEIRSKYNNAVLVVAVATEVNEILERQ